MHFKLDELQKKENDFLKCMEDQEFWNDSKSAEKTVQNLSEVKAILKPCYELRNKASDMKEFYFLIKDEKELSLFEELVVLYKETKLLIEDIELKQTLSGQFDVKDCYLTINAGAGGTDSCDWALMLLRMYARWAEIQQLSFEILDEVSGDVVGIKSAICKISGIYAYGYAKAERGVHRLVRISPFDSNAKRHTSFASVDVIPELDTDIQIDISPDDIRIDTYRASGAGGQHVNKTESAVRITHIPSGIVVCCQNERSQLQNKETCFKVLKARLFEKEQSERKRELSDISGEKKEIAWGSQIRSYVFHPYTLVKDTRTKYEIGNVHSVMDGNIQPFIREYLRQTNGLK